MEFNFTESQKRGYDAMMSGRNVVFSGDAGTGKSYTIEKFISSARAAKKNVLITAPTGVAALNVGGSTVHRTFKIPLKPLVEPPKFISQVLKGADVIIIEEIGMCRFDVFNYIAYQILAENKKRAETLIKDPIQLIVSGDFFQLPPVMTDDDRKVLEDYYGFSIKVGYAFLSALWSAFNFKYIMLTEVMRQKDKEYSSNLAKAKIGDTSCINYFHEWSSYTPLDDAVNLYATNRKANEKNDSELDRIDGLEREYRAQISGEVKESDKAAPEILRLKVGARVMSLLNSGESSLGYVNGSLGTVEALGKNSVRVRFDNGSLCDIDVHDWDITTYRYDPDKKAVISEVIGTYSQIPLKLAWAITIHKSQGQTYDKVNVDPYCWDYGQLYTALSRCTQVNKMHLFSRINPSWLKASADVVNFYRSHRWE